MNPEALIARYLPCIRCKDKCCKRIGDGMMVAPDEDADRSGMSRSGRFYEAPREVCIHFDRNERCEIYARRPFACRIYPLSVIRGRLFADDGCPWARTFVEGHRAGNPNVVTDLPEIKRWIEANVPAALRKEWEEGLDAGKDVGIEILLDPKSTYLTKAAAA